MKQDLKPGNTDPRCVKKTLLDMVRLFFCVLAGKNTAKTSDTHIVHFRLEVALLI